MSKPSGSGNLKNGHRLLGRDGEELEECMERVLKSGDRRRICELRLKRTPVLYTQRTSPVWGERQLHRSLYLEASVVFTQHRCNHPGTHPTRPIYLTDHERPCPYPHGLIRCLWLSVNNICSPGASEESHHILIACIQHSYTILDANYRLYCANPRGVYSVSGASVGRETMVNVSGHFRTCYYDWISPDHYNSSSMKILLHYVVPSFGKTKYILISLVSPAVWKRTVGGYLNLLSFMVETDSELMSPHMSVHCWLAMLSPQFNPTSSFRKLFKVAQTGII